MYDVPVRPHRQLDLEHSGNKIHPNSLISSESQSLRRVCSKEGTSSSGIVEYESKVVWGSDDRESDSEGQRQQAVCTC